HQRRHLYARRARNAVVRRQRKRPGSHPFKTRPARIRADETHQLGSAPDEDQLVVVSLLRKAPSRLQIPHEAASQMGPEEMDMSAAAVSTTQWISGYLLGSAPEESLSPSWGRPGYSASRYRPCRRKIPASFHRGSAGRL